MNVKDILNSITTSSAAAAYTPKTPYTGTLPKNTVRKGSKGSSVKACQKFLNWCINAGLKVDGKAGKKTVSAIKKFQKANKLKVDGVFGKYCKAKAKKIIDKHKAKPKPKPTPTTTGADKLLAKAKEYCWPSGTAKKKWAYSTGSAKASYKSALKKYMKKKAKVSQSDCGYFVSTCVRASGINSSFNSLHQFGEVPAGFTRPLKGKKIPSGFLKPGDIIRYKKTSGQHTLMYYGNGKIASAGRKHWFPVIKKDNHPYNSKKVKVKTIEVLRAK